MNSAVTSLQSTVAGKQDKLTFDSTPTSGSNNPVTSGGIFNAINNAGGGEVWEEIDLSNFPTDWVDGDKVKFITKTSATFPTPSPNTWTSTLTTPSIYTGNTSVNSPIIEISLPSSNKNLNYRIWEEVYTAGILSVTITALYNYTSWNTNNILTLRAMFSNGVGYKSASTLVSRRTIGDYIYKMWRLKK